MNTEVLKGGKYELSLGSVLFPAQVLGDITINYAEGVMEAPTQAGTRKQPSGKADTAEASFTLYLTDFEQLRVAFDIAEADPVVFGSNSCSTKAARPVNIHPVCNGDDAKEDFHIFAAMVNATFNPTLATSDALQIEVTIQMQPTDTGYLLVGYPDPSTPQYWDVATQAYVDIG